MQENTEIFEKLLKAFDNYILHVRKVSHIFSAMNPFIALSTFTAAALQTSSALFMLSIDILPLQDEVSKFLTPCGLLVLKVKSKVDPAEADASSSDTGSSKNCFSWF